MIKLIFTLSPSNGLLFQDILPFILCMLIPVVASAGASGMFLIYCLMSPICQKASLKEITQKKANLSQCSNFEQRLVRHSPW